jgi:PKD repeat protein
VGGVPGSPAVCAAQSGQSQTASWITSIWLGGQTISSLMTSNKDNTDTFVQELVSTANGNNYSAFMADPTYPTIGTLHGAGPFNLINDQINLENTTVAPFTAAVQSDLYELRPNNNENVAGSNVGYFQLNTDGSMSFTRASAAAAPVAGFTVSPTNGFAPLNVTFTDASTGTITTWVWTFGDGLSVTNSSNASVNHLYTSPGTYSVSLTDNGPGGANTATQNNYIVAYPKAELTTPTRSGNSVTFGGSGCPIGVEYRILCSTNLLGTWNPIATNNFSAGGTFSFTGTAANGQAFFRLVSP